MIARAFAAVARRMTVAFGTKTLLAPAYKPAPILPGADATVPGVVDRVYVPVPPAPVPSAITVVPTATPAKFTTLPTPMKTLDAVTVITLVAKLAVTAPCNGTEPSAPVVVL